MSTSFPIICTLMLIGHWLIAQPAGDESQPWEVVKEDQHLMVYARKAAHSKIKEIKVETEVTGSLSSVIAVLRDIDAYPDWIYNLKSARQLPQATAQENFYYSEIKFPWPLSNRDYIARSQLIQDTLSRAITNRCGVVYLKGYLRIKGSIRNLRRNAGATGKISTRNRYCRIESKI